MKIAFWNVGIKTKKNDREIYTIDILNSIISMINESGFDAIFLCEVDEEFNLNSSTLKIMHEHSISLVNASERISNRLSFDICGIFNNKKTKLDHEEYIIYNDLDDGDEKTGNNIKIGARFKLEDITSNGEIDIIISHWPSKSTPGYSFKHKDAAERLGNEVIALLKNGKQVILMGDYNLSPYEMINNTNLKSYNNKYYATRSSLRMYNLSFKYYDQHSLLTDGSDNHPPMGFGTFISKNSRITEIGCEVFDQAHVSSSFIEEGPWILNEKETKIFFNDTITTLIYGNEKHLDHLPISLEIIKNER